MDTKETQSLYQITAGNMKIELDERGQIVGLINLVDGTNHIKQQYLAHLLKLVMDKQELLPVSMSVDHETYTFHFDKDIEVAIKVVSKETYATFEVTRVEKSGNDIEMILWGPITTSISQTVGEAVGVVYDDRFAIGIKGLNDKSQGGFPYDYQEFGYPEGPGPTQFSYDWSSASKTDWGSVLQVYTLDSTKERIRPVRRHQGDVFIDKQQVPPIAGFDGILEGSKIALYGCSIHASVSEDAKLAMKDAVLSTISDIEIGEDQPHPMLNGEWQKTNPEVTMPYFISGDLSIDSMDEFAGFANKAGIKYVYRDGVFESDGHYRFNSSFENSDAGMKKAVDKAAANGIKVGVHTMGPFIEGGDPYNTPIPNPGLASGGSAKITQELSDTGMEVFVDDDSIFRGGNGSYLQIDNELMSYSEITQMSATEWKLTLAGRNQWDTLKVAHHAGATIKRIWQNAYGGTIGGHDIIDETSLRLAEAFNNTGLRQISFDGLEDANAAGYSLYQGSKLVNDVYRNLVNKEDYINDSSNLYPNIWSVSSRMNWGEPWGAAMREGMIDYRYMNQFYYERNFFPKMLGWFQYNGGASTIDIEWMLAKSAGFDAGYALVTSLDALRNNGNNDEVMYAIKQWDIARRDGAFTKDQQNRLREQRKDWHLETVEDGKLWNLYSIDYPVKPTSFSGNTSNVISYSNQYHDQSIGIELLAQSGDITNPSFTADNGETITFSTTLENGNYLVYVGEATAKVYDGRWKLLSTIEAEGEIKLKHGTQKLSYTHVGSGEANLRVLTQSLPEEVFVGNKQAPLTDIELNVEAVNETTAILDIKALSNKGNVLDLTNAIINVESSNPNVIAIHEQNQFVALTEGKASITVSVFLDSNYATKSLSVNVDVNGNFYLEDYLSKTNLSLTDAIKAMMPIYPVNTYINVKPILPETVKVLTIEDKYKDLPVSWEEIPSDQYAVSGSIRVSGIIDGIDAPAILTVKVVGEDPDRIDKRALRDNMAKSELLYSNEEDYTTETWAALQGALAVATVIEADSNASQLQVNETAGTLSEAMAAMKIFIEEA